MSLPLIQQILRDGLGDIARDPRVPFRNIAIGLRMASCRTGALGYHVYQCSQGHEAVVVCNSCRDRSCRTCAQTRIEKWIQRQLENFLPVKHGHMVFTLPAELRPLWRYGDNERVLTDIMLRSSSLTIVALMRKERFCGGTPGVVASRHTWNQRMELHPHVHLLVSAGGVDRDGEWRDAKMSKLLPHRLLAKFYSATFINMLRGALRRGRLELPPWMDEAALRALLVKLKPEYWYVHTSHASEGIHALKYNAAYALGGCIGNRRVVRYDGAHVTIVARADRRRAVAGAAVEHVVMARGEFVRRLLSHVPAKGVHLVRSFGIYANAATNRALKAARACLGLAPLKRKTFDPVAMLDALGHDEVARCPICREVRQLRSPNARGPPTALSLRRVS